MLVARNALAVRHVENRREINAFRSRKGVHKQDDLPAGNPKWDKRRQINNFFLNNREEKHKGGHHARPRLKNKKKERKKKALSRLFGFYSPDRARVGFIACRTPINFTHQSVKIGAIPRYDTIRWCPGLMVWSKVTRARAAPQVFLSRIPRG